MRGFFCDFETTGLMKRNNGDFLVQPGITQIGVVVTDYGLTGHFGPDLIDAGDPNVTIETWSTMVNPEIAVGAWEEKAMQITGIGPDTVKDAPTFFEVFPKLAELAKGCDFWGGYNTAFDKDVLWYQLQRFGFQCAFPWPPQERDVMKMVSDHFEEQGKRGTKNIKQTDAYERLFGEPLSEAHDALADIRATVRIYRELSK